MSNKGVWGVRNVCNVKATLVNKRGHTKHMLVPKQATDST